MRLNTTCQIKRLCFILLSTACCHQGILILTIFNFQVKIFFLKVIEDSAQKQIRDTLHITRYRVSGWTEIGLEGKI